MKSACAYSGCSYSVGREMSCSPGGDDCSEAYFQTAFRSPFHDEVIRELTQEINEKLHKLGQRPPRPGERLSILWTPDGPFLAWCKHDNEPKQEKVGTMRADRRAANRKALGLHANPYVSPEEWEALGD